MDIDLNGWIGDRKRAGIIGAFGVPGKSDNDKRIVEFYAERGLCVGNTYFKHSSLHKCRMVARVESAVEVCGSMRVRGKNPKSVWWNDRVKDEVERSRF